MRLIVEPEERPQVQRSDGRKARCAELLEVLVERSEHPLCFRQPVAHQVLAAVRVALAATAWALAYSSFEARMEGE